MPLSYLAMGLIGAWLAWRGAKVLAGVFDDDEVADQAGLALAGPVVLELCQSAVGVSHAALPAVFEAVCRPLQYVRKHRYPSPIMG